jgi:hypothetical protein
MCIVIVCIWEKLMLKKYLKKLLAFNRPLSTGVHFMMADGGFSVDGQENIQVPTVLIFNFLKIIFKLVLNYFKIILKLFLNYF